VEWSEIALFRGVVDGQLTFEINVSVPDATAFEAATARQLEAIKLFYSRDFPELTYDQASALLSYREFARLCAEALFGKITIQLRKALSACLAAYVSSDPEISSWVVEWQRKVFERGSTFPRVRGSPYFEDVSSFADYLDGVLEMNGLGHMMERK
jgi:hypothetical protein